MRTPPDKHLDFRLVTPEQRPSSSSKLPYQLADFSVAFKILPTAGVFHLGFVREFPHLVGKECSWQAADTSLPSSDPLSLDTVQPPALWLGMGWS